MDYRRARSLGTGLRSHVREHRAGAGAACCARTRGRASSISAGSTAVELVRGHPVPDLAGRVRRLGGRPQAAADGGLLPLAAPPPRTCSWTATSRWAGAGTSTPRTASRRRADARPPKPVPAARGRRSTPRCARTWTACGLDTFGDDGPRDVAGDARRRAPRRSTNFVDHRLPLFGRYSGRHAGWRAAPSSHSRLFRVALNLHLLPSAGGVSTRSSPIRAPPPPHRSTAVEGFVRQVIGWREFVRGIYWRFMPCLCRVENVLRSRSPECRASYWTGETDMRCLAEAIFGHTIDYGYTHHIERLMVLGHFCRSSAFRPATFIDWHHAMFLDADRLGPRCRTRSG